MDQKSESGIHSSGEYHYGSFSALDRILNRIHKYLFSKRKGLVAGISVLLYAGIVLLFGNRLMVSANYFVILPVLVFALCYYLPGGLISGAAALPFNLLLFQILGHPEYSPESKLIAEVSGIAVGTAFGYLADYFRKLDNEIRKRIRIEEKLRRTLNEKELLLQEMHHRVKNNLNIIKSIVALQKNRLEDPVFTSACDSLLRRIFAIATIHEQVCRDYEDPVYDFMPGTAKDGTVDPERYIKDLVGNIIESLGREDIKIGFIVDVESARLEADSAGFIGLIANEVISNALIHAFPGPSEPAIDILLRERNGQFTFTVSDNGKGFSLNGREGLGLRIIRVLTEYLGGEGGYGNVEQGSVFTLFWNRK